MSISALPKQQSLTSQKGLPEAELLVDVERQAGSDLGQSMSGAF